jgi:hypothetical protein
MPDPNLPLLEDAVRNLARFLDDIVFDGEVRRGLLESSATLIVLIARKARHESKHQSR